MLAALALAVSGFSGAKAEAPTKNTADVVYEGLDEAQLQDLGTMAKRDGISLDEAITRYAWHEPFSIMVNEIRERFPDEFAGARIEGNTLADAWIAFREKVPAAALGTIKVFSPEIVVHQSRGFTERDIDELLLDAHYSLWAQKGLVKELSSGYDIETGTITLEAQGVEAESALDKASLKQRLVRIVDRLPVHPKALVVKVEVLDAVVAKDDTVFGGVPVTGCTSGFIVTNNSGTRGVTTAGHCDNNITYDGYLSLNFVDGHQGTWGDIQYHTSSEYEADNFYYNDGVTRDVLAVGFRTEGQELCKYGKATGATCDEIYQLNHCNGDKCHLTAMHNRKASGGDSGGPWYYGRTAYGIHQGYKWWSFKNRDLFTPVTYFDEALNIDVATTD